MPGMSAGTSLEAFTKSCTNIDAPQNYLTALRSSRSSFTDHLEIPKIIAQHVTRGNDFLGYLAKYSNRDSLMIYVHRDEQERLISAVKHVAKNSLCAENRPALPRPLTEEIFDGVTRNTTHCIINEEPLLKVIEQGVGQIGLGTSSILTCRTYDAFERNAPNLVFMNYKQAGKLQTALAKRYCPDRVGEKPEFINTEKDNPLNVYVRLSQHNMQEVSLNYWLSAKAEVIQFALQLDFNTAPKTENNICEAKTRRMEDDLFNCPDETLHFSTP